jgi:hypothetical protein
MSITVIVSLLLMNSWNPSKPMMLAYDFWVKGGKFPVLIEIVPPEEKAMLSSRSEFQAKLLTLTSWNICA